MAHPPLALMTCLLSKPLSDPTSHVTSHVATFATSSNVPKRLCTGMELVCISTIALRILANILHSTDLGATALTVVPPAPNSVAQHRVNPSQAVLQEHYMDRFAKLARASTEGVLMIRPGVRRYGRSARVSKWTERISISYTLAKPST